MSEVTPLNLNDIANIVNIFDAASSKGAFTGPDIEIIGAVRNRIQAVVDKAKSDQESEEVSENKPSLNINDIATSVKIIDLAASKGAFVGPDLEAIGSIRNRAAAMVEAAREKEKSEAAQSE